jgi:BioD-like phosphotransacetylase family protein
VANSAKYLFIASTEPNSGKSATILGLAQQLKKQGIELAYAKPLGTFIGGNSIPIEEDVQFISEAIELKPNQIKSPLLYLDDETIKKAISHQKILDYRADFQEYIQTIAADLILIEGPGTLWEGSLFSLSISQMSEQIDAPILLVIRYHSLLWVENLLSAKQILGDRLLGVLINDIPPKELDSVIQLKSFLEQQKIPVFGTLPQNSLLRTVSVRELAKQLKAKVLCREDRLDLMVENLTVGAMNVNSALEYFRQGNNKAVITGGDRADLQLAALETSTQCLILTGHVPPQPLILSRAEDLEIPILSVDLDTLNAVEIINQSFGKVRIQEPIKVECIRQLMTDYFDIQKLLEHLGIAH